VGAAQAAALKKGSALKAGGRPPTEPSVVLDALFFRLRNCGPWRDLPEQYGPWQTIYGWHRLLARLGVWFKLLKSFAKRVRGKVVLVDGTHILAHQSAANPRGGAAAQAMGKTRGGRNSKLMALTDRKGRLMSMKLVEGQTYEGKHVLGLLPRGRKWRVVGDKGFDSDKLRGQLEAKGHAHCFPGKKNRKRKVRYSKQLYRQRYRVENFFCRIKQWATLSMRRDKLALHFTSLLAFAAVIDWMQPFKRF
jgi:transposase